MIAEQKARELAAENQSRRKQKQGDTEKRSSTQSQECPGSSTKRETAHQQKRNAELAKASTKYALEGALRGQTRENGDACECPQEHVQCCEFIMDPVGDSKRRNDRERHAEHSTRCALQYQDETVEYPAGLPQRKGLKNTAESRKELPLRCQCEDSGRLERETSHLRHSHTENYVTGSREQLERGNHSRDAMERRKQCHVRNQLTDHDIKMHSQPEINDHMNAVAQSQHRIDAGGQEAGQLRQMCRENNEEQSHVLQQVSESLTSLFIKPSSDVTPYVSHVGGGNAASGTGDEGRRNLMLPRATKRSVSPGSDEGCSVALPPECSLTPCSSEDDIEKRLAEKSASRWTWPPVNDQDTELQGPIHRRDYGRCGSSDSAVCLLPSDDERKLQMKDPEVYVRQTSADGDITDFVTSEDKSGEKAMVFDRYVDKATDVSFDLVNLQYVWRHGSSSTEPRRECDIFPDAASRRNSGDIGDAWYDEMRDNANEISRDDICDSGIDRETFLVCAEDSCWDLGSVEGKTGLGNNRYETDASSVNNGYPYSYRQKQLRKLKSMISCESGVLEDEDCSRKNSAAEAVEDDDGYLVELRRQSAQSFQTDDDESSANSQYRYWRTPSVVVSDYSDDVPYFTSVTLEELEQLQDVTSAECASGTGSVSGSGVYNECALRTPERKASDCSTCSTLSGDEDASCEALLQPIRTTQKVGRQTCLLLLIIIISLHPS
jgi:hypothetical protein